MPTFPHPQWNILIDFCFGDNELPIGYDIIGPWTEVKLDILRQYAAPYSRIVTKHGFYHLYIDAYAAGGSHISRTTGEVVPGSPLIAQMGISSAESWNSTRCSVSPGYWLRIRWVRARATFLAGVKRSSPYRIMLWLQSSISTVAQELWD